MSTNILPARSAWRLFPWVIVGGMSIVVAVNAVMITTALTTFPGNAGRDGFGLSNRYNIVLDRVANQNALGWTVTASTDTDARAVLVLSTEDGAPIVGARIAATAQRPLGPLNRTDLSFSEIDRGRYRSAGQLPLPGQWDLTVTIDADSHAHTSTQRIVVR